MNSRHNTPKGRSGSASASGRKGAPRRMATLGKRQRILIVAALLTTALAWTRASVYGRSADQVHDAVRLSGRVAENNQDFVINAQDALQYGWFAFPAVLLLLTAAVALVRVGQYVLIGVAGLAGPVLGLAGLLFPSTGPLQVLAGLFLATTVLTVATAVVPGRSR
ncbi:hypothetical protein ACH4SP_40630 [Streptomyces sp. NPDC021093]|uniref:hypothetical protein n=1 Tax=Streptomyces sp. NPDC021093 TaxID=3365112 RepID=UPI0037B81F79